MSSEHSSEGILGNPSAITSGCSVSSIRSKAQSSVREKSAAALKAEQIGRAAFEKEFAREFTPKSSRKVRLQRP